MRCAYGANNPSPYGGITRIKSSVEVLRLPLSLSAPVRLCSHLRAPVRQKAVCSSQKVAFSFSLSQNTTPVYACVYPFSGVSVQKPLCQSGKRQVCPEPLRLLLLCVGLGIVGLGRYSRTYATAGVCVGLGIPASSDYSHTDAEPIVCVGLGILKPGGYSRTYAILGVCVGLGMLRLRQYSRTDVTSIVCVGMGIVGLGRYSRMYAILGVCVVLGILKPCQYSQTAVKAHAGRLM